MSQLCGGLSPSYARLRLLRLDLSFEHIDPDFPPSRQARTMNASACGDWLPLERIESHSISPSQRMREPRRCTIQHRWLGYLWTWATKIFSIQPFTDVG
jgi:hypothetical protein